MSSVIQTAERSSHKDPSENVIFQRHLIAYKEASKLISGSVLEIGSGEGYGLKELSKKSDKYLAVDKYNTEIPESILSESNVQFKQMNVPPLSGIPDNSVDYVVTFQVIEHIVDDKAFISEIYRVLKKGGRLILTTPNKLMSLSRNPWHIREYSPQEMIEIVKTSFNHFDILGIFGNDKVTKYYEKNKRSVQKYQRLDFLNLEKNLPRWILRIPYDILNRLNRYKLQDNNEDLVAKIKYSDYYIEPHNDMCLDFFCIATK
ncbi:MAG: SAM-dependent methyltransferase [Flavobacteriales bacterium]|nr:SAM-dependent methyltransferase [Flavobacteriales bacterium]|tara:strand:- start:258 stop:1037 length:780 start_codon:yes stop_codon:yes gene_type:complete